MNSRIILRLHRPSAVLNVIHNTSSTSTDAVNLKSSQVRRFDEIPGPKAYPLIGAMLSLKQFGGEYDFMYYDEFTRKLQANYGDIVKFETPFAKQIYVFDPEYIKQILRIDGDMPQRPELPFWNKFLKSKGLKHSLLFSQKERWRNLRTASNPIVARPSTVSIFLPQHNDVINSIVDLINERLNGVSSVTIEKFEKQIQLAALELISVAALDVRIECMDETKRTPQTDKFIQAVDEMLTVSGLLLFDLPLYLFYPTKNYKRFFNAADIVFSTARMHVTNAYLELEKKKDDTQTTDLSSKTILQQYWLVKDKYNLDKEDIVSLTADFIMAGVDTTSTVLHFILYELGKNPSIQDTLANEINSNLAPNENVTDEKLEKMHFLKAVVKETLRLHIPTPGNGRIIREDLVLNNYLIPAGTITALATPYISTSERFFKNPLEFNPTRWIKNDENYENMHPYAFLPFGFGTRMCIGRRLVEQEIYVYLAKIIQKFKIEYVGEAFKYRVRLVRSADKPLNLKFTKRV